MAGGQGTRLRPLTSNLPKPMMPIANRPMMEHVVDLLRSHGLTDIVVTLAFLPDAIRNHFGDGSEFGVRITYVTEEVPLGTAGSVRNAAELLDDTFLVISGDVLTDVDLGTVIGTHRDNRALATIGLTPVENPLEFGIVITDENGAIERFLEKPTWGQVFSDTINTGIFVLEPEIFDHIEEGRPVDFSGEVFPALLEAGEPLFGSVVEGYWEDVGTLDSYLRVHADVLDRRAHVVVPGFAIREGVWLGEGVDLDPEAMIDGPALIGDNCRIEARARLGPYTVLGSNVRVREGTDLERVVIGDHTYLGHNVDLKGTVTGRSCDIRDGARALEGAVLGDECFIGAGASLAEDVKVFPFKTVEAGAVVNSSIVWESRGARNLFGRDGVSGLANVDLTPELAVRVAMAWGSTLPRGSTVVASRDTSRSARALKRALMAGLNCTGVNVLDLEAQSVPVTRFMTRSPVAAGGVTIRLVEGDPDSVVMRFFDDRGLDITEARQRSIERVFQREDYRRVMPSAIGEINVPSRPLERYAAAIAETLDMEAIGARAHKIVIDYSHGSTALVLPSVLAKLEAEVLAVNPYVSTVKAMEFNPLAQAGRVADLVRTSGADLGVVMDPDGEHLMMVDDTGKVLDPIHSLLAVCLLLARTGPHTVAVPVAATAQVERIVEATGGEVRRVAMSTGALQRAALRQGVDLAVSLDDGFIFGDVGGGYDAAATLAKVLELLARTGLRMSEVVARLEPVHVLTEAVPTPWDSKGQVMRRLVEQFGARDPILIDGIRIPHGDGWVLVLPDPGEPLTRIWAEGPDDATARRLVEEYTRRIVELSR